MQSILPNGTYSMYPNTLSVVNQIKYWKPVAKENNLLWYVLVILDINFFFYLFVPVSRHI